MVQPNLLNPIKVKIEKVDKTGAIQDHIRREPVNRVARADSFEISAQVAWESRLISENMPQATQFGTDNGEIGYIVVRTIDLAALSRTVVRGDKIIKMGKRDVLFYVTDVNPHAHYADQGDFTLECIQFADRPSTIGNG